VRYVPNQAGFKHVSADSRRSMHSTDVVGVHAANVRAYCVFCRHDYRRGFMSESHGVASTMAAACALSSIMYDVPISEASPVSDSMQHVSHDSTQDNLFPRGPV
jgi:hypothetical protein